MIFDKNINFQFYVEVSRWSIENTALFEPNLTLVSNDFDQKEKQEEDTWRERERENLGIK